MSMRKGEAECVSQDVAIVRDRDDADETALRGDLGDAYEDFE